MRAISALSQSAATQDGTFTPRAREVSESRALVAAVPAVSDASRNPASGHAVAPGRSTAAFLAQLIATQNQEPQTRDKRRADPRAALAAYEAGLGASRAATPAFGKRFA